MNVIFLDSVHEILEQRLVAKGWKCFHDYKTDKSDLSLEGVNGIVIRSRFTLDRAFLEKASDLKWIARSGSGLENIDLVACKDLGIHVFNSPEGNRTAVAEHAMGMLLMLANQLRKADREVREMQWNRESNRGFEIEGKTVAIIGYGVMGKAFAKRLSGFDCHVLAYDKYLDNYSDQYATQASMQEIYERADIVSLHVPLKEDTKYLVNAAWLKGFKKPIALLNTSRGGVVQIAAIEAAIVQGNIKGVGLDVLEYEESSFEKINLNHPEFVSLAQRDNVVLSPHVAGWTVESYIKLSSVLADKIDQVFKS